VVAWQPVLRMMRVLFVGVAACYRYSACTKWWFGNVIGMVRVLCGGVAACYGTGACTVWLCGKVL